MVESFNVSVRLRLVKENLPVSCAVRLWGDGVNDLSTRSSLPVSMSF